ncbi:MAG: hypothetical protein OEW15_09050 [Nitrospirota bacterium]|nr:hypothetical protein [Nitrospirota bacterium]
MSIILRRSCIAVLLLLAFLAGSPAAAEIEWTEKRKLTLDASPLDMVTTPNGRWLIVLTPGEVLVYSAPDMRVLSRFGVDPSFDKLLVSGDEQVILASTTGKTLKFLQLDEVFTFTNAGVPFMGPENAPVTITVFSDYQ